MSTANAILIVHDCILGRGYKRSNMKHSIIKTKIVAGLLAAVAIMSGCSLLPGKGGSSSGSKSSRNWDHSDKYKSAEQYCEYWFGPCEEVDTYTEKWGDSERTVHVMKDKEFGFEYTVSDSESKKGYFLFSGNFAYYYINEFLKSDDLDEITEEYDLEFENYGREGDIGSPTIRIHCERELSAEDNKKILDTVMRKLDKFDSERKVFNKAHDNISVFISVWSAPWESDTNRKALYHVENDTFGDNYKEQ